MKSGKHVYLHCADASRRSVLAFVIETRGYQVLSTPAIMPDVALFVDDARTYPGETAFQLPREVPQLVMITPERRAYRLSYPSHAIFVADQLSTIELLEWLRIMSGRKRGPKPGRGKNQFNAKQQVTA